jgi:hypothetical protein
MSTFNLETGRGGQVVVNGTPYPVARALWVGTLGDVHVRFPDGGTAVYTAVQGLMPIESVECLATTTTATNITTIV